MLTCHPNLCANVPYCLVEGLGIDLSFVMDRAGNLRGGCMRHGNQCQKFSTKNSTSHNCICGCPAFEHVSSVLYVNVHVTSLFRGHTRILWIQAFECCGIHAVFPAALIMFEQHLKYLFSVCKTHNSVCKTLISHNLAKGIVCNKARNHTFQK